MVRGEQHEPLFKPFRALGYVSEDVPFCVQRRGKVRCQCHSMLEHCLLSAQ